MAGGFITMVYAVLKANDIDTSGMSVQEAIKKFDELKGKSDSQSRQGGEAKRVFDKADELGVDYDRDTNYQTVKSRVEEAQKNNNVTLTKQEWAQYYKVIGDEQHGDFIYKNEQGQRYVSLDNKIVIDNGDFENPRVQKVLSFQSNEAMNTMLNRLAKGGIIK